MSVYEITESTFVKKKITKKHWSLKTILQIRFKLRINKRKCEMLSAPFCTLVISILQVIH